MKRVIKLTPKLLAAAGFDFDIESLPEEDRIVKRLETTRTLEISDNDEKIAVGYISTVGIDMDQEIVLPDAFDLKRYAKNPVVLFNHDMNKPIGKAVQLKRIDEGVLAKTQFGSSALAEDLWTLVKDGILKTFSVGFIPTLSVSNGTPEFDAIIKDLRAKFPRQYTKEVVDKVRRIITKAILFEYSLVTVPANEDALILAVAEKSMSESTIKQLGLTERLGTVKTVIEPTEPTETVIEPDSDPVNDAEIDAEDHEDEPVKLNIIGNVRDMKVLSHEEPKPKFKVIGHDVSDQVKQAVRLLKGHVC